MKEFKNFAMKGNLLDIGVAFVMGGAFGKVVSSFTDGVVSPLLGLMGGVDLSKNMVKLKSAVVDASGKVTAEAVYLKWGDFITNIINFTIVAFIMFLVIKGLSALKRNEAKKPVAPAAPSTTEQLLMEIRDSLRK